MNKKVPQQGATESLGIGSILSDIETGGELGDTAALAARYGLKQMGVRPQFRGYVKDVLARREFLTELASAKAFAESKNTYLGQLWTVLTPLLNSLVYVLIFGLLLNTSRGMNNVIGFIVVGTFVYGMFSTTVTSVAKSIKANVKLVQSLQFPRVILPLAIALKEFMIALPGLAVMSIIALSSVVLKQGADALKPTHWIIIVPAILLITLFATGIGFVLAKYASRTPDLLKILPFILRLGMYASGVIFAVQHILEPSVLRTIMEYQPVAVYLDMARYALLNESSLVMDSTKWISAIVWAVVVFGYGFISFWRDEARYGRE